MSSAEVDPALGYIVALGEYQATRDPYALAAPVYFGWAPKNGTGLDDLMKRLSEGYPGKLRMVGAALGFAADLADINDKFRLAKMPGSSNWYYRCDAVNELLALMRGDENDVEEDDEEEEVAPPAKTKRKQRSTRSRSRGVKQSDSKSRAQSRGRQAA